MSNYPDISLQLLLEGNIVDEAKLELLRNEHDSIDSASLLSLLYQKLLATEEQVTVLLADEFGMSLLDISEIANDRARNSPLNREQVLKGEILLLDIFEGGAKAVLIDPSDLTGVDALGRRLGLDLEPWLCTQKDFLKLVDGLYPLEQEAFRPIFNEINQEQVNRGLGSHIPFEEEEESGAIVEYVQLIIKEALKRNASDIHLEPLEKRFRIRFRVDGILQDAENPPKRLQSPIISRIKLMSDMSIAEKRLPQDGRIQLDVDGRSIDFRVSVIPSTHGESIVMRVLDKENLKLGLKELGFNTEDESQFKRIISKPDGIILVTGPTGSGKSTTLYSCLNYLNKPDRKIITVEDPVEYQLSGINQVQVQSEIDMTFAAGLRAILRQAPNIIMVGEIRDTETVEVAVNASLTGHLVLSTLHTNDALGAVARLRDLGVAPFLVSSSLRAVMAQRLVRKVCAECSEEYFPSEVEMGKLKPYLANEVVRFQKACGCVACRGTGYRGRIGIFEIVEVTENLEKLIYKGASLSELRIQAESDGMNTMFADGIQKAAKGLTTIEEVFSVTAL